MKREIIDTEDGSKTIHLPELNESYHSIHGAVQESKHVFLKSGWDHLELNEYKILEIGLGSGLNAILTLIKGLEENKKVHYTGIEAFPITLEEFESLCYTTLPDIQSVKSEYEQIHKSQWRKEIQINSGFTLLKQNKKLKEFLPEENTYNLIYFDAFAPRVQPEMWTLEVFQKMYHALSSKGTLVTYCSKGDVRRNMMSTGFEVEKIPGPPGKREMLRGHKI